MSALQGSHSTINIESDVIYIELSELEVIKESVSESGKFGAKLSASSGDSFEAGYREKANENCLCITNVQGKSIILRFRVRDKGWIWRPKSTGPTKLPIEAKILKDSGTVETLLCTPINNKIAEITIPSISSDESEKNTLTFYCMHENHEYTCDPKIMVKV